MWELWAEQDTDYEKVSFVRNNKNLRKLWEKKKQQQQEAEEEAISKMKQFTWKGSSWW